LKKHSSNIAFFVDDFLIYDDVLTPADGIIEIGMFLDYWFPKKAMWASPANARSDINDSYYDQLQKLDSKQKETLSLAVLDMRTKEELDKYL